MTANTDIASHQKKGSQKVNKLNRRDSFSPYHSYAALAINERTLRTLQETNKSSSTLIDASVASTARTDSQHNSSQAKA